MIEQDVAFDDMKGIRERGAVLQLFPQVFADSRGSFSEVLKFERGPNDSFTHWIFRPGWMMQVNRSKSSSGVVRGLHAQKGGHCQAKLVEAVNRRIYDVIVDARPDSATFGSSNVYVLDPEIQNMVFVPRGFLHGFVVPFEYSNEKAIFSYYCDNVYSKEFEVAVNPMSFMEEFVERGSSFLNHDFVSTVRDHQLLYSEKDTSGMDYWDFMTSVKDEYEKTGIPWYV